MIKRKQFKTNNNLNLIIFLFNLDLKLHRSSSYLSTLDEREKIRQHVEKTVSKMLGGSLDDVSVSQLYRSEECKYIQFVFRI